ncbi:hypothetical protein O9992_02545 [Vibrio lentus]|nr:hypothetical protein [Vibrio lentus]
MHLSVGENDTALDKVDGAGDMTYEFGASAGDASDAYNASWFKFQGATSGLYGVSYFETDESHAAAEQRCEQVTLVSNTDL